MGGFGMTDITIAQLPNELLGKAWPHVGPYLIAGAQANDEASIKKGVDDVFEGRARVWIILEGDMPLAAFLTSVVKEDDGSTSVDVYGLGGRNMLKWGKQLSDAMVDYAKANGSRRVIFKGRKALMKAYEGIRPVGQEGDGTLVYERLVA